MLDVVLGAVNATLDSLGETNNGTISLLLQDYFVALRPLLQVYFGNDYFSAGLGIMVLTAVYNGGLNWYETIRDLISTRLYYNLTITSKDEAYSWVEYWIGIQKAVEKVHDLSVKTEWESDEYYYDYDNKQQRPSVVFLPAEGLHRFYFEGTALNITRAKENESSPESGGVLSFNETESFAVSVFGFGKRAFLKKFIEHCMEIYYSKLDAKLSIYVPNDYRGSWRRSCLRESRAMESVILDDGLKEAVLKDMKVFLGDSAYYQECGLPYRRGYLLHGHPGTGKTSFIMALASHFKMSICMVSLSAANMSDQRLNDLLNFAPQNSIILLEDVDAAFSARKSNNDSSSSGEALTFAGVLNALDGAATQDKRIMFMTTNHIEQLSPALIRPGRVDMKVKLDLASIAQIEKMFFKFFPPSKVDSATQKKQAQIIKRLLTVMPDKICSTAQLQCFFMKHRSNPKHLEANAKEFIAECEAEVKQHALEAANFKKDKENKKASTSSD